MKTSRLVLLSWTVSLAACTATLPTLQTAATAPEGDTVATAGLTAAVPVGIAADSLDEVRELGDLGTPTRRQLMNAAEAAALMVLRPPAVDGQLSVVHGVTDWLELGGRVSSTAAGGQVRLQFLDVDDVHASIGLSMAGAFGGYRLDTWVEEVEVERFRGLEVGLPVLIGYDGPRGRVWGGPRLHFARTHVRATVCPDCVYEADADIDARTRFVGAQTGFALGAGKLWLAVEVVVGRANVEGTVAVAGQGFERERRLERSGLVVEPALGLVLRL